MNSGKAQSEQDLECNFPQCNNKANTQCKICERTFCDFHLKPKHTGSLNYITNLTDPNLIKIYEEDGKSEDGHPCPKYHEIWQKGYNAEKEKLRNSNISFDKLKIALDNWIEKEREAATGSNYCRVAGCINYCVVNCKSCNKNYCLRHASPTLLVGSPNGHLCTRYTNTKWKEVHHL